jgi:hypothetical protein
LQLRNGTGVVTPDPALADRGTLVAAECGCRFWVQSGAAICRPCHPECTLYRWWLGQVRAAAKPLVTLLRSE